MKPEITYLEEKKLLGMRRRMSLADNQTVGLWQAFMSRRREIKNAVSADLISLQVYEPDYFDRFVPEKVFEKWALVEVSGFEDVPEGFETFTLPGGLYAVFKYKGAAADFRVFEYIFTEWLPASEYALDDRPHFEVLGEKYQRAEPDSEEEIWIPVRPKN
ncbi:MAG: AraC family transcriptional regulator [Bacteroidetes bacterium]|nr:MAG: AraC family transcriptional regulator [Bacteroidota bacterium]